MKHQLLTVMTIFFGAAVLLCAAGEGAFSMEKGKIEILDYESDEKDLAMNICQWTIWL